MQVHSLDHLPEGEMIREQVRKEFKENPLLKSQNILIDTDGLDIVLEGDVETDDMSSLAEDVAGGVFGVLQVRNEIHVSREAR
ncbi:MAG TPA: BON domain-containing protein [Bacteriovoracaceae bacterium]|nr:BON domain-containing protein [Bacteriovoracaceae bacterium]